MIAEGANDGVSANDGGGANDGVSPQYRKTVSPPIPEKTRKTKTKK